jgi:TIR domain
MAKKGCKVFVSYSRHDEALVKPLAGLLGVASNDAVFLDVESLRPGDSWKLEIEEAVRTSSVFVLCWCCESSRSEFVKREITLALEDARKRLVPVLFCPTPLPEELAKRQWINLNQKIVHVCNGHGSVDPPKEKTANRPAWPSLFTLILFIIAVAAMWFTLWPSPQRYQVTCDFVSGPRAGERGIGFPIDIRAQVATDRCTDERGSDGFIVRDVDAVPAPPNYWPLGTLVAIVLVLGLSFLTWLFVRDRETDRIAHRAVAYFERLK